MSVVKLFTSKDLQMPLLISVVLQLSQQLSGINAVSIAREFEMTLLVV